MIEVKSFGLIAGEFVFLGIVYVLIAVGVNAAPEPISYLAVFAATGGVYALSYAARRAERRFAAVGAGSRDGWGR